MTKSEVVRSQIRSAVTHPDGALDQNAATHPARARHLTADQCEAVTSQTRHAATHPARTRHLTADQCEAVTSQIRHAATHPGRARHLTVDQGEVAQALVTLRPL